MNSNKSMHLLLLAGALLSLVIVSTINHNFVLAQGEKFKAKLKGESEVPPVNSAATGKAKFKAVDDTVTTKINITGITDVTAAYIYKGVKGQNGEPVVDLLKTGKQEKTEGGVMIQGEIKASDLQGPMAGTTLKDLQTAMGNEQTYVNIHTSDHKDGEIRGKINVNGGNVTADAAESIDESTSTGSQEESNSES